ncbi:MAG: hypothetical protein AAB459_04015 [Patescibacteria group bacterium]
MSILPQTKMEQHYQAASVEQFRATEIIIGHEFGAPSDGAGLVNRLLAQFIVDLNFNRPIYVAESIANALQEISPNTNIAGVFHDTSANTLASKGGTMAELEQVQSQCAITVRKTLHVAHARHVSRVLRQARLVGFDPIAPPNLPEEFDPASSQWWCRGPLRWKLREVIGQPYLKLRGQL